MQNYINHVVFVIDGSSSMGHLSNDVVKVFDKQIANLANLSKSVNQETRVSVYLFADQVQNLIFDMDVLRLPSLKTLYRANGMTALIDATLKGIEDLKQTCQLYGDHSFLMFVITDGGENASKSPQRNNLNKIINGLPDNWTLAAFVPGQAEKFEAQKYGFPKENVSIWSTDSSGLEETGNKIEQATQHYFTQRSKGIRGKINVFSLDTSNLKETLIKQTLDQLKPNDYKIYPVNKDSVIKDFVEKFTKKAYTIGSAYYQLTKPEKIQASKQICIQNKSNGKMYGGMEARQLLGLPDTEVKVTPDNYSQYNIFVQSTSVNRKLVGGTNLVLMN